MALPSPPICPSLTTSTIKPSQNPASISISRRDDITTLLKSCSNITHFLPIHAHLISTNLINDPQINSQVLSLLVSTSNLDYAHQICGSVHEPEPIFWNTLMEKLLNGGSPEGVLKTYYKMVSKGVVLDLSTFHFLLHACSRICDECSASEVHGRVLKSGFGRNRSINNNLMGVYSKFGKLGEVCQLFEKMRHRNVVSWNTMISCYVSKGLYQEALSLFDRMIVDGIMPDEITMVSLISACAKLKDLETGKSLHFYIKDNDLQIGGSLLNCLVDMYVRCGEMEQVDRLLRLDCESEIDVILSTTLISGYMKSNKIDDARSLFDRMTKRSLVTWTAMISGYAQCGFYSESIELFREMMFDNVIPDEIALVPALSACTHLQEFGLGRAIHGIIVRYRLTVDGFLGNALLDLYGKSKKVNEACRIFENLPCKNVVSWNSMLDGFCRSEDINNSRNFFNSIPQKDVVSWNTMVGFFVSHGMFRESFELFREMQNSNIKPDKVTLIGLLSSCASAGALNHGIWVHAYLKKYEVSVDAMLSTSLLDMYGKCGRVDLAYELFSKITEKNVFVWTAMMSAYAMEGQAQKAVELFIEMEKRGTKPDYITFIALLSACSHGGLVDEGYKYFEKMRTFYNISPKIQHYGCMVDLLGRVGNLEEAIKFIDRMPVEADVSIWSSLMRASGSYQNVELAEHAFKHLVNIDPNNHGAYMLLANIYANASRWDDVSKIRTKLHDMGLKKKPGLSLIEQNGNLHEFTSGDFSHPKSAEIQSMLEEIGGRFQGLKVADTSSHHSERLAVAFGLLNNCGKSPISVVNNVTICRDCHSVMKFISESYETEIVIRDNYRFHRFKNGYCSCKDYW